MATIRYYKVYSTNDTYNIIIYLIINFYNKLYTNREQFQVIYIIIYIFIKYVKMRKYNVHISCACNIPTVAHNIVFSVCIIHGNPASFI